jgi:type I restriction enzyme S subunit
VHLTPSQHHGVLSQEDYMTKTGTKVVLNLSAPDNMKRVQPGDLIAHLRSFQGGLEKSDLAGKVSTAYTVIEPLATADPNFFRWVLKSPPYIQTLSSSLEQLRDGQSVKFGDFAAIPLPLPPIDEQRRIADFLDDRVARIDQIIAARRTQMDHVDDALDAEWNSLGARLVEHGPVIPLRRVLASIVDGPFGSSLTSSHYTDEGTRVIRLGNIGKAAFRDGDAAFISDQYAAELRSHSVSPGDLLMAGLGDERWPLGRCAVAPEDLGPAIVKADCYRIRLDARVRHDFAAAYISSPRSRAAILLLSRGSTRARLNTDLARGVELPLVGLEMQREYLRALGEARSSNGQASRLLEGVVHRFREYKQSLITAAVTGELDVTTACSGIPG